LLKPVLVKCNSRRLHQPEQAQIALAEGQRLRAVTSITIHDDRVGL
jgi:hypothetical protein